MKNGILSEMTIHDVRDFKPEVVLLGISSTEPHGPAMPYGTDYFQCTELCRRSVLKANAKAARVLMYPTLPVGNNVNFKAFPFACRVRVRTLMDTVLDIIEALEEDGIKKIVLVCGHGGNMDALKAVLRETAERHAPEKPGAFVALTQVHQLAMFEGKHLVENPSPHGGEFEASLMLSIAPELVKKNELMNQPIGKAVLKTFTDNRCYTVKPWHLFVPLSGGGDTRKASAKKGNEMLEKGSNTLAEMLVELSKTPWGPNFPFVQADL